MVGMWHACKKVWMGMNSYYRHPSTANFKNKALNSIIKRSHLIEKSNSFNQNQCIYS